MTVFQQHRFILAIGVVLAICCASLITIAFQIGSHLSWRDHDFLIYSPDSSKRTSKLYLYDPVFGLSGLIVPDFSARAFSVNVDGQVAYTLLDGIAGVYSRNIFAPDTKPIELSPLMPDTEYPILVWSPDGEYLAFTSISDEENKQLYVWSEAATFNVTPNALQGSVFRYQPVWSHDGRLAFTISYFSGIPSEVYIWDGRFTKNVSQNARGIDANPAWSNDGLLAFRSAINSIEHIFVWNGELDVNDMPNSASFIDIAPGLPDFMSRPVWTSEGHITFSSSTISPNGVIYLWDGKEAMDISQNPISRNDGASWSADGRWAFLASYPSTSIIYVRDTNNRTLLTMQGDYGRVWSAEGIFAFCSKTNGNWNLSIWDSNQVLSVGQGWAVAAQWLSSTGFACRE